MPIEKIYTVLVPPLRNQPSQDLPGSEIKLKGELFELLNKAFQAAAKECSIQVQFRSDNQTNQMRTLLQNLLLRPSLDETKALFTNLATISTHVFGLALCFALLGHEGRTHSIYIARFPATEAIRTQLGKSLKVEIVKDIYMKSHRNYKAALFQDTSVRNGFWQGGVVDKQINNFQKEIANYWIFGFLQSDFLISGKSGSYMFAKAVGSLINKEKDPSKKDQLVALATLSSNFDTKTISLGGLCDRCNLSVELKEQLKAGLDNPQAYESEFVFDKQEFAKTVAFRSEYLDNGAILTASTEKFEECFQREHVDGSRFRYSTEGNLTDVKIKKRA